MIVKFKYLNIPTQYVAIINECINYITYDTYDEGGLERLNWSVWTVTEQCGSYT